ncbi:caspase family protein [Streptomyces sp. NPDC050388]|uniref:caspase family protein n=1 Tax=Streptomyces sp. NPDC050388 TaxID=3155781 RepID=UPI0034283530
MILPDPTRSRAVLIGSDRYRHLANLPAVGNNVRELATLFMDPSLWGLPSQHCMVLHNPSSVDTVLDVVHDAAAKASDCLVVYFAGHGLLSPDADLLLALPESDNERLYRSVPYHLLRHELVDTCTASSRVVILDCCYSGRALQGHMTASVEVADCADVEGTYVMTASSETKLAWSPEGEEFTAFSGELVKALTEGVPNASDPLEMGSLFQHVRRELVAKGRPVPQQRARNSGHSIALTRNRWAAPKVANHMDTQTKDEPLRQVDLALTPGTGLADLDPGHTGLVTIETVLSSPIEGAPSDNAPEPPTSQLRSILLGTPSVITFVTFTLFITVGILLWLFLPQRNDDQVRPATNPCNLLTKDQAKLILGSNAYEAEGSTAKGEWVKYCSWVTTDPRVEYPYHLTMELQTYSSPESARIAFSNLKLKTDRTETRYCDSDDVAEYWNPLNEDIGDGATSVTGYVEKIGYNNCGKYLLAFHRGSNVVNITYDFAIKNLSDSQDKLQLAAMRADDVVKSLD